jgi:hypothetical protein
MGKTISKRRTNLGQSLTSLKYYSKAERSK